MKMIDVTGRQFGRLKVLYRESSAWMCLCTCGNKKPVSYNSLAEGKVKSCGCLHREMARDKGFRNRKHGGYSMQSSGSDRIKYQCLVNMRERARHNGYECNLEMSDMPELTESCPILGMKYVKGSLQNKDYSPTIDRKNPNLPYLKKYKDNLLFISHRANRIKSNATHEELLLIAKYVASGATLTGEKSSLMDLNGEIPNKAEGVSHRERLNEKTAQADAIVCSHGNMNHESAAEMTAPSAS